ncbi:preprotein translocase subunit Sec61beta [Thermococci archaeon]|nr:MAG: preprotein translocase subunit Sec61beta [Thermococci archaeon]RLF97125.1 MAG: preprotein translocase subunit Sec61beta [Thermococci archaeon]
MPKGKKERTRLPPTGAGLIRYFDEDTKGLRVRPEIVIGISVGIAIVIQLLRMYYP